MCVCVYETINCKGNTSNGFYSTTIFKILCFCVRISNSYFSRKDDRGGDKCHNYSTEASKPRAIKTIFHADTRDWRNVELHKRKFTTTLARKMTNLYDFFFIFTALKRIINQFTHVFYTVLQPNRSFFRNLRLFAVTIFILFSLMSARAFVCA